MNKKKSGRPVRDVLDAVGAAHVAEVARLPEARIEEVWGGRGKGEGGSVTYLNLEAILISHDG